MQLSMGTRLVLILAGTIAALVGLVIWASETGWGGNEALEGYETGYLPGGMAEVREMTWPGLDPGQSGDYEVRATETEDVYELVFVDGEPGTKGELPVYGTYGEITTYLDSLGPIAFFGAPSEVTLWLERQRLSERDYATAALIIGLGVVLIIAATIPPWPDREHEPNHDTTVPIT